MTNIIEISASFIDVGKRIEDLVYEHDIDYIDACLMYCEINKLEVEFVADIVKKNHYIRAKVQREAEDLNFLKKTTRLHL